MKFWANTGDGRFGTAVWNVIEYKVEWPDDGEDKIKESREKYRFNLIGSKVVFYNKVPAINKM